MLCSINVSIASSLCCVCDTLLHKPRCTPCHVYEAVNYLNLNLMWYFLSLASLRLFHGPTRATSAGCFVLGSEAIRDVEQTTPVCKATSALPSTMQGAQKAPLFN